MRKLLFQSFFRGPLTEPAPALDETAVEELAAALKRAARRRLGRSLSIREIDAGSCNGCELEIHALSNAYYDVERFGIRFVASPRHADVLMVTGPVTKNMRDALERTYHATPDPKWVIAWEIAHGMADVSPAATRWPEGSRKSFPSIFIFPAARRRPLRFCRDFSPCSIERPKPPLRLEALETISAIPGRLGRRVHSSRIGLCDDAVGDPFRAISGS